MPDYAPRRIQRRRTKGWRMPEGAIYVGRPTMWGNPWRLSELREELRYDGLDPAEAPAAAVESYREWLSPDGVHLGHPATETGRERILSDLRYLRGHDLVCWCRLDQPCHADVLLELANAPLTCEAA